METNFQAAFGGFFELMSEPLHKQCFLNLSIYLITMIGIFIEHIIKVENDEITEFTIISFPVWDNMLDVTRVLPHISRLVA